ncbi:MAG: type IX secretion system membrane protein PorP/SprF [Bacteroidales bacterium]|nr:type IX secretion system membrane protein PorP/SprF [Bacteroidales bacterium]
MKANKKYILIFALGLLFLTQGKAQQIPHFSQFWFNEYLLNPAFAGTKPYYQAKSNNRYQWVGVDDSPKTFILSGFGPERKKDMGYGAQVFSDVTGPTSRLGFYGSYAYNLRIKDDIRISMGLSLGLLQFKIDGSQIIWHDQGDLYGDAVYVEYLPDADFGTMVYAENWHGGIVAKQLFNYKLKFNDVDALGFNRLKTHFIAHGAYRYDFNDDWSAEAFAQIKMMLPAPIQLDLGARAIWKKMAWAGLSWRTMDAVSIMIGYEYEEQISFGYSYDITTSKLNQATTGTHEIMIGFKFSKIKKSSEKSKF